ncbi:MAG: hypothetical protein GQ564_00595 [Bacteroidales bacterium]|nr:hypothetical protein [Bacteroidales bacterium]
MEKIPSIFNDVTGPVMRGPSSSHTAASWRIARTCLDILNEPLKEAVVEFDTNGAWATNYREQGTVMGINGGLLGLEITDPLMKQTDQVVEERALSVIYKISSFRTEHPNTVRLSLEGIKGNKAQIIAASLGGGSFEIQKINGFNVQIKGDCFELIVMCDPLTNLTDELTKILSSNVVLYESVFNNRKLINIKLSKEVSSELIDQFKKEFGLDNVIIVNPILPIVAGNETEMPFSDITSLCNYAEKENLDLGDLGILYEKYLSGHSEDILTSKMDTIIKLINNSIKIGLEGTKYKDRILHRQSHLIERAEKSGKILQKTVVNDIVANVTAIMESKSAMEVIVANPTAGSCGTIGGVINAISKELNSTNEEIIKAYFASAIVGVYFAKGPGFSAEEHGCQVECGAASGMAAAAIAQLFGGTAKQAIDSASMAIQNMVGLICDPVADRVEVPCLGKNVNAAVNALTAATMVCSGFDAVIPFEEVLQTVIRVSDQMPQCVKCSGTGGLAITKTAIDIKEKLKNT